MLLSPASFKEYYLTKWVDPAEITLTIDALKKKGKKIVTLNGSFDLLHAGHLHILYEASRQGDTLVVALNTDASIQRYKSAKRPIIPLLDRLHMIAALAFVDYVTCFDETDPRALLEKIQPHVHVNGAEYGANCIEADIVQKYGGQIYVVPLVPGLSTSNLIKKIVETCA